MKRIALVGDYDATKVAHRAIPIALKWAVDELRADVTFEWLPSRELRPAAQARLEPYAALWCVPGSPYQNTQGVIDAIRFARVQRRPFLGTCGGFQHALLEYAQAVWGVEVRRLDLGIQDEPIAWVMDNVGLLISQLDILAGVVAGVMVAALALLFSRTKVGRGLRAVADDHAAAASIGIPLKHIWALVWGTAGVVALVTGMLWGARSGVQFALIGVALKALPVLIIGGFTSVPGVIVAGLIVGVAEKVAEVYVGPMVNGGIEGWLPYALAVLFLLYRPEGLFGEKIIRRV